jgi:gamma-glutamyltranspeptidase/glutathione hydrolase
MISAPQPEAAEAGLLTLKLGGNAIDAAITCALVQGVVDPQMCGIAGFGSLQVYCPGRDHYFIDFHGNAPGSVTDDMWADLIQGETPDGFGFILKDHVNDVGYQSVATPGSLKAYFEAQTKHGTMDWADVVAPAIEWAERGSIVLPQMAGFWNVEDGSGRVQTRERLRYSETGRAVYFNDDGSLKKLGQTIHNPDLANTLRMIAKDGADVFYRGEIAEQIASDMAGNGGLLTL